MINCSAGRSILWLLSVVFLLSASPSFAVTGEDFEYKGYFRSGTGANFSGGGQNCYNEVGTSGNQFRLGNECSDYGEAYFIAHVLKPKKEKAMFFDTRVSLAYNPPGYTQYENPNFSLIEVYIEGGHFDDSPLTYWVGKRFYREPGLHMDDFFYFADSSGNGGGVQNIPLIGGKLAVALLTESGSVVTTSGRSRTLMADVRLFQVPISPVDDLNFWATVSVSKGGVDSTGIQYENSTGTTFGVKYHRKLGTVGDNNLALVWGRGLSQGLTLAGTNPAPILGANTQNSSWRLRAVNDLVVNLSEKWAFQVGAVFERWNTGGNGNASGTWLSLGARPIYFFSEVFSVAVEVGGSSVTYPGSGQNNKFIRTTIAPQITPKIDFFARPALRAYVTNTWGRSSGFGLQGEVWF